MDNKKVTIYDVRNSEEERKLVETIVKNDNRIKGSKYMRETFSLIGISYRDRIFNKNRPFRY